MQTAPPRKAYPSREFDSLQRLIRLDAPMPGEWDPPFRAPGFDWESFRRLAIGQDLLPLVYERLKPYRAALPAGFEALEALYAGNGKRNLILARNLLQAGEALKQAGIPSIALKGPALAIQAYGDLSLRHFADLDILVQPQDVRRAGQMLQGLGWDSPSLDHTQEHNWLLKAEKDITLQRGDEILELHWNVAEPGMVGSIPVESWWQDLRPVQIFQQEVRTLSPENTFLFLSLHGVKNSWRPLKWVADLAYFVSATPDLDWPVIAERARAWGLQRGMRTGLLLAERYCGLVIPPDLAPGCQKDRAARSLARQVIEAISAEAAAPSQMGSALFFLHSRERWRDRFYYVWDQAMIPKQADWQPAGLPADLLPALLPAQAVTPDV